MLVVDLSWLVGIEPEGAARLRTLLDDAAASLDASAGRVQRLLDEAGTTCGAPMDIRGVARTCEGTAEDLSRRMLVIEGGGPRGRIGTGLSLRGPHVERGPSGAGCVVDPAPLVVMSCNPPLVRPEILGQPGRPLGSEVSPTPSMPWSAGVLDISRSNQAKAAEPENDETAEEPEPYKTPRSGTGQERASDVPSWLKNDPEGRPRVSENGGEFAKRMLDKKYGEGNWPEASWHGTQPDQEVR